MIRNPPVCSFRNVFQMYKKPVGENFQLIYEKPNLYLLFIEKSLKLIKNMGEFGFIIPNSLTGIESAAKVRGLLINKLRINTLINLKGEIFENAGVESCILMVSNQEPSDKIKYLSLFSGNLDNINFNVVKSDVWRKNRNFLFDISGSEYELGIIQK
ncbi:MAG: N-6 DNA methylase [Bacteroidales bacterium]